MRSNALTVVFPAREFTQQMNLCFNFQNPLSDISALRISPCILGDDTSELGYAKLTKRDSAHPYSTVSLTGCRNSSILFYHNCINVGSEWIIGIPLMGKKLNLVQRVRSRCRKVGLERIQVTPSYSSQHIICYYDDM